MFLLPELVSFGPMIIPVPLFLLGIIGLATTYFVYLKSNQLQLSFQVWKDVIVNGLITFVLVWKLSYLLLDPMSIFHNLRSVLLSNGGTLGIVLGLLISFYVVYRTANKSNLSLFTILDLTAYWLLITLTFYWFVLRGYGLPTTLPWGISYPDSIQTYHPISFYKALLMSILIVYLVLLKKLSIGKGLFASYSCTIVGTGLLLISTFEFHSTSYFGFSLIQWLYVSLPGFGLLIYFSMKRWAD